MDMVTRLARGWVCGAGDKTTVLLAAVKDRCHAQQESGLLVFWVGWGGGIDRAHTALERRRVTILWIGF